MMRLTILILALFTLNTAFAQDKTAEPIRLSRQEWRAQKKQIKEKYKKENPLIINHGVLVAGASMIGAGVGLIGISNGSISKKKEELGLHDIDELEKLNKQQRIFNYVGGGIGIVGAILCLSSSLRKGYWTGYTISKRLSVKDKNKGLALVYTF